MAPTAVLDAEPDIQVAGSPGHHQGISVRSWPYVVASEVCCWVSVGETWAFLDFLDLCLPFEDQERRMVSTAHHPFPWHKVAKLLYCLVSGLFKAWKERAELICLCYWHLYVITWWSCGDHVVISEWPSQSTARKHCAPVQSGRSG